MNCVKGDLAYVFRSQVGNYGKTVTCLRLATADDFFRDGEVPRAGDYWLIDRPIILVCTAHFSDGSKVQFEKPTRICPDAILRPLRDPGNNAVDESLLWVRIPEVDTV